MSQPGKLVGNSLVGTCLTLPNLGFLWVFFKYPKISNNWNLLCFPVVHSEVLGDSRKYPYHTTDGFKDFRRGGGIHDYGILKAWGGIYDLKSQGMGEFHRWDFWSRKCRVSSWKTLLLWTFVVRK